MSNMRGIARVRGLEGVITFSFACREPTRNQVTETSSPGLPHRRAHRRLGLPLLYQKMEEGINRFRAQIWARKAFFSTVGSMVSARQAMAMVPLGEKLNWADNSACFRSASPSDERNICSQ